jgi:hypothetical protein
MQHVFIVVFYKAEDANVLESLSRWGIRHRLCLSGDVAMFIRPHEDEPNGVSVIHQA